MHLKNKIKAYFNSMSWLEFKWTMRSKPVIRHYHITKNYIKYFFKNLRVLGPHLFKMRDWDKDYIVELFSDGLKYLSRGLKNGYAAESEKRYRECLYASKMLKKIYSDPLIYEDKTLERLREISPMYFEEVPDINLTEIKYHYKHSEDFEHKIRRVAYKRIEGAEQSRKKDIWEFINKRIERWWD